MERESGFIPKEVAESWDFSGFEGLQTFTNDESLDLPEQRRDLSNAENIRWLLRNVGVRNDVPREYVEGLEHLLQDAEN